MKDFLVKLEVFEGPFDLLLSLIDKEELDIYEVSLTKITAGYLEYLGEAEELNLDLAGEFLLMAAILLKLKSKKLLPESPAGGEEADLINNEGELLERLVEYKIFKELAEELQERETTFGKVYFRPTPGTKIEKQYLLEDISSDALAELFRKAWQMSLLNNEVKALYFEEISVDEKKKTILKKVAGHPGGFDFFEIFENGFNRYEIVVSFLAILELVRQKIIRLRQKVFHGPIFIFPFENSHCQPARPYLPSCGG